MDSVNLGRANDRTQIALLDEWNLVPSFDGSVSKVSEGSLYSTGRHTLPHVRIFRFTTWVCDRTPALCGGSWADDVTLREACAEHGYESNCFRNGQELDPKGTFDVTPYADATFQYFWEILFAGKMGKKVQNGFLIFWWKIMHWVTSTWIWDSIRA